MGPYQPNEILMNRNFPLKQLFSSITDLVEVVGRNRVIMWSNHGSSGDHPLGDRQIVGAKCFHLYEDVCKSCHNCPLEGLFRSGERFNTQREIARGNDENIRRWVRAYPIVDSKNRITAALKISFDITKYRAKPETGRHSVKSTRQSEIRGLARQFPFADSLSRREREVLVLVGEGFSNRQIAELLVIKPDTVKSHVCHIFNKLGVNNRTHAAVIATRLGLI